MDTSGFFAMRVRTDVKHLAAERLAHVARRRKRGFLTTDYVLNETETLLTARGQIHLLKTPFETIDESGACRVEWTDVDRFHDVTTCFLKRADQKWSFTDCLSFRVVHRLRLREALTKDVHLEHAGFLALLR